MNRIFFVTLFVACAAACGKGGSAPAAGAAPSAADGPASIVVPDIEVSTKPEDIAKGEATFTGKGCNACHKVGGGKLVGPDLQGVTKRRSIKWIARMIAKPEVMVKEDEQGKELFRTYMTPMANQNVDLNSELPALLAYLKAHE